MLLEWLIGGAVVSKVAKSVVKETKKAEAKKEMEINAQLAKQEESKRAQEFKQEQIIAAQKAQQQRAEQAARLYEKSIQDRIEAIKAGVPRIPVYQPVSVICPCCSGNRTMDMKQGMAKCPFCGFEEPLTLLRYENDYSAIERKVAEAYRQAAQEEFIPNPSSSGFPTTPTQATTGCATAIMSVMLLVGTVVYAIFLL